MARLLVSTSPHLKAKEDVRDIMWTVVMMLVPAGLMGTVVFGWHAAFITVLSVVCAVATEFICQKVRRQPITVGDGSAVLAGMLFAFVMPPNTPWYVAVVGSVSAIMIGKHFFGGLGCNIWNPALVGRAVAGAAYASAVFLAEWPIIKSTTSSTGNGFLADRVAALQSSLGNMARNIDIDAVSQASPLKQIKDAAIAADPGMFDSVSDIVKDNGISYMNMLTGHQNGCIGETSAGLLLLGGIILIFLKIVDWRIPIFYLGSVALLSWMLPLGNMGWFTGDPLFSLLGGGLMIGAFFMATDMVTSPMTGTGKIVFALGCGLLTVLIRNFGGYPEGVCYSILLMNTAVPLIDRFFKPRLFGKVKK